METTASFMLFRSAKKTFPHWYVPDTSEQMHVKKASAKVAYQDSIDYLKKINKADEGEDFTELQLKHFCICLSSFHAITVHLKCNDFHLKYKPCISASCPLGSGGRKWRTHHKLGVLGKSIICTKNLQSHFPLSSHTVIGVVIYFTERSRNMCLIVLRTFQL